MSCVFHFVDEDARHDIDRLCFSWDRTDEEDRGKEWLVHESCRLNLLCRRCAWFAHPCRVSGFVKHSYFNLGDPSTSWNIANICLGRPVRRYTENIRVVSEVDVLVAIHDIESVDSAVTQADSRAMHESLDCFRMMLLWFHEAHLRLKPGATIVRVSFRHIFSSTSNVDCVSRGHLCCSRIS
jgi:hypothetical protein